jgi:hypothetical protein
VLSEVLVVPVGGAVTLGAVVVAGTVMLAGTVVVAEMGPGNAAAVVAECEASTTGSAAQAPIISAATAAGTAFRLTTIDRRRPRRIGYLRIDVHDSGQ